MTNKIQISRRLKDGTIMVIGADTAEEFNGLVDALLLPTNAEHVHGLFYHFAEAGGNVEVPVTETRPRMIGETCPRRAGSTPEW